MDVRDARLTVERPDELPSVVPTKLGLDGVAPVKATGDEQPPLLAEREQAEVKRLVVERAQAEPVLHRIRTPAGVPVHMCGLQPDGGTIEPGVQTANRALVPVGAQDKVTEGAVPRPPRSQDRGRIEIEAHGPEDALVQARREVGVEHLVTELANQVRPRPQDVIDRFGEAAAHAEESSERRVGVPPPRLQVLSPRDFPQPVVLESPKRVLGVVRVPARPELHEQAAKRLPHVLERDEAVFTPLNAAKRE